MLEELETLKKDVKGACVEIGNVMNVIEESVSSIKEDTNEKCKTLANTVIKLYSKISKLGKATNTVNNAPKDKPILVKKQTAKPPSSKPNPSKTEAPATSKSKITSVTTVAKSFYFVINQILVTSNN